MASRFTNTEKWNDAWFCELKPSAKLLFLYLCDQCDIAGFLELNIRKISFDLGIGKQEAESSLTGLSDKIAYSKDRKYIFVKNFLKHQKNLPLNPKTTIYNKIIAVFEGMLNCFDIQIINDFFPYPINTLSIPYQSGIGNSNSIGNKIGGVGERLPEGEEPPPNVEDIPSPTPPAVALGWRDSFEVYQSGLRDVYLSLVNDKSFIAQQEKYNPGVNIQLSLEKACMNFWATEAGWKHKKKQKTKDIDWKSTLINAITQPLNKVYKPR